MNKSKSSLIFNICQTEGNTSLKSSTNDLYNSTLPNIRTNLLNGFFYECPIEKYNEKINLWQKAYLCVKRNYLYLYDKKPKILDKPKEFLFLNNKITFIFHKKLFKMKAVKCFVVNFKINNEALSKSLIEDNKHNLFISFKSKKNYDNFEKVVDNVIKAKQYTNSVSPNLLGITKKEKNEKIEKKEKESKNPRKNNVSTDKKMCKNLTSIHLKNKSMNEIAIKKSLIFSEHSKKSKEKNLNKSIKVKNEKETKQHDNILCTNNSKSMNSENKSNNCIQNVFTFSKVENLSNNTNDKKLKNSNSTNKSKQQNSNSQRINNNKTDNLKVNENNIFLENNKLNNQKKSINYFTINFSQNNSIHKSNNIFDNEENNEEDLTLPEIPKFVYSIRRKKEKEKEDIIKFKRYRTKSCFGFNFNNLIFPKEDKEKEEKEDKIKKIKIKLKDFNSYCHKNPEKKLKLNLSTYSHDEKNLSLNNTNYDNQDNSDTTNLSIFPHEQTILNDIQEEEKNITESKSQKDNSNNNMSFGSLKSFKSESKEGENNETNNKDYLEKLNIYSYVDASETSKNKSIIEDSNPLTSLNVPNIRNQITNVIKENEENISQQESENSDVIFTPRLMEEIQQNEIITNPNSNNKDKYQKESENESQKKEDINDSINSNSKEGRIEISNNHSFSNTINTSITRRKNNLRFENDLNELIQSLDTKNSNKESHKTQSNHNNSYNENNETIDINLNAFKSNNNSNEKEKNENTNNLNVNSNRDCFNFSHKFDESNEKDDEKHTSFKSNLKLSIPFNKFFNENLSFYFMDFNFNFISNDKSSIKELFYKIDNNLIFIYDSNILNLLLKKLKNSIEYEVSTLTNNIEGKITKNKILGKIYESLKNKYAKYFILCEMIAIISKKELSKIIITSMEIYNKKKEINQNEPMINFDNYIYNLFNKYLTRNENNKEYMNLYENILPKEIKKVFEINDSEGSLINIIKQNIHPYTLFNSMQYHNKIYININLDTNNYFNFNSIKPFDKTTNTHYISPYILEKWKFKASLNNGNNKSENNETGDINILNINLNNTNPINESFDSNSNYSRDMSNTSLSCIALDKNNKFRVSIVSKNNDTIINNNLFCGLIKKEKNIYEEYKLFEKTEEMQKINLFQNIILNINQNEINSAMKNCEYFLQKYQNSTLFLHPLIYLCLAFIHNKINGFDSAQKYIKKSLKYLTWLFPHKNCFLFYEIEYKYLLIILNNEENIILNNIENITNIFQQCNNLWKKYYEDKNNSELKMHEIIFKIYFKITDTERNDGNFLNDLFYNNIKPLINDLERKNEFWKDRKEKNCDIFWKLFIEFFKNCPGCGIMVFNDLIRSVPIVDN